MEATWTGAAFQVELKNQHTTFVNSLCESAHISHHEYYIDGSFKWSPLINMVNTLEGTVKSFYMSPSSSSSSGCS